MNQKPDDLLPLKPNWLHILLALSAGDQHGYGIMQDVLERTNGKVRLWPATLYGSLDELCTLGWIRELDHAPSRAENVGHRRWFGITAAGRRTLAAEVARLQTMITVAEERLSARGKA